MTPFSTKVFIIFLIVLGFSIMINILASDIILKRCDITCLTSKLVDRFSDKEIEKIYEPPQIPTIYKKNMLSLSFEKHVKTKEDFKPWKEKALSVLDGIINMHNVTVGKVKKIDSVEKENYTINKFTMEAMDGDIIIFYELLPNELKFKIPAVFLIPGTGNQGAKDLINIPSNLSKYYYQSSIGMHIANEGYAVYVIENRGWGERSIDVGNACYSYDTYGKDVLCSGRILENALRSLGYNINEFYYSDSNQVLKYIYALNYIDNKRVAIGGLSLGAGVAKHVSIGNPQINATIIASGTGNFHETFSLGTGGPLKYFDNYDTDALIAPRPLYISFGLKETGMFNFESRNNFTANFLNNVYDMFDARDNFYYIVHEGAHEYHIPSVLHFLNQTIGKNSDNQK